jgi:hypothetical protein
VLVIGRASLGDVNEPEAERPPATERHSDAGAGEPGPAGFELPDRGEETRVRLRRRLFGYRPADVEAELSSRGRELGELRRDVAALWLAFAQHERTIHRVLDSLEHLSGVRIDPPGGRAERGQAAPSGPSDSSQPVGGEEPVSGEIAGRLSDLDQVLEAIERATASLERSYAGEPQEQQGDDAPDPESPAQGESQS